MSLDPLLPRRTPVLGPGRRVFGAGHRVSGAGRPVLGPGHPVRHEAVNVVITAVLLASLVCLLIVGAPGPHGGGARPSTEPPLTNGAPHPTPQGPAAPAGASLSGR